MPVFKRRVVLKIARNLKFFLTLEVGATRGSVTGEDVHSKMQVRKRRRLQKAGEPQGVKDRRILRSELTRSEMLGYDYLNSRCRGASTLLVSFCNVRDRSKPVLAAVDLRGNEPRVRWIEVRKDTFVRGATGLCFWNDLVCVAHQGSPGRPHGFVILDPESDFEPVLEGSLTQPAGVHSVCFRDGELYFVTSRRDSVYRATLDGRSGQWSCSHYWTFPESSGEEDENHLNAIECVDGDLYVSGFGRKQSDQWPSATQGFVYNIDRDEYKMKCIYHPHSLLEDSDIVWTCESARNRVVSTAGDKKDKVPARLHPWTRHKQGPLLRGLEQAQESFGEHRRREP